MLSHARAIKHTTWPEIKPFKSSLSSSSSYCCPRKCNNKEEWVLLWIFNVIISLSSSSSSTSWDEPVWPDLAKFCNFGKILKVFGQFLGCLFYYLANFCTNFGIFMLLVIPFFIAVNGQRLNSDIVPSGHTGTTEQMNEASTCPMTNI